MYFTMAHYGFTMLTTSLAWHGMECTARALFYSTELRWIYFLNMNKWTYAVRSHRVKHVYICQNQCAIHNWTNKNRPHGMVTRGLRVIVGTTVWFSVRSISFNLTSNWEREQQQVIKWGFSRKYICIYRASSSPLHSIWKNFWSQRQYFIVVLLASIGLAEKLN